MNRSEQESAVERELSDAEFADAFETCRLPAEQFHHRDHLRLALIYLRLALIYLRRCGFDEAGQRLGEAIRRYAAHLGKSDKYHETVTMAWMQLVASARSREPGASFDELLRFNPELLEKSTLERHYSPALLRSDAARLRFVPPDRDPLPNAASAAR